MKRASLQGRIIVAALTAALLSSVIPAARASVRNQNGEGDWQAVLVNRARATEVKVTAGPAGVLIEWRTSYELDNLGFNIHREQNGSRFQVNPSIIATVTLTAGQGTEIPTSYPYQWFDAGGDRNSRYYLEQVDLTGARVLNGPFTPVWSGAILKGQQAKLLTEVSATGPLVSQTGGPAGSLAPVASLFGPIEDQWAVAAQPGLKIGVTENGWYRLTQPEMVAAGFDVSKDARNLRLFVDGAEVAIVVSIASGSLSTNDFLEFYGTGVDTPTTDAHIYFLINGSQAGRRVSLAGSLHPDSVPTPSPLPRPVATATPESRTSFSSRRLLDVPAALVAQQLNSKGPRTEIEQSRPDAFPYPSGPVILALPRTQAEPTVAATMSQELPSTTVAAADSATRLLNPPIQIRSLPGKQIRSKSKRVRSRRRLRHSHRIYKQRRNHVFAVASSSPGYLYDLQLKERRVYFSSLLNGSAENFFGGTLLTPPTTKTFKIAGLQTDSQGTAILRIGLQGTSNQAHLVNVLVNDGMVGSLSYDLQQFGEQTFNVPVSQLHEGDNVVKFVVAGGSSDFSLFSYAQLTYPRLYRAEGDQLAFALRSTRSATIENFTTPNIRILDISDPVSVQEVRPITQPAGSGYSITVPALGAQAKGSRTLLAQPVASFLHPASITFNQPSTLNQSSSANSQNAADLVIIAHKSFLSLPNLALLAAQRQSQGFTVKVVDVEDVFDEFSYGAHTPQAITDFLLRARANWIQAPKYLLLVGAATFDPRNYNGGTKPDLVPTKLVDTVYLETGSDDALADFDNNGIAEIAVGRLPATTAAEANLMLSKVVNFSPGNVPQNAVMVADTQGSYFFNFEQANNDLISLLPSNMQANVQKVYRAQQPSDGAARATIISKINSGTALVNYSGHGNVDVWTGAPIFSASDALALTNGNRLPLVVVMDCLNGYFVAPNIDCVSEALMKAPNGGAVASFSSSGLTIPIGQHEMGQQLFSLLYSGAPMTLGDATRLAKAATTDIDVRRTWILFGDPTMKIR